jgi:solute carrier family 25 phosphate transporter 3
MLVPLDLIKTRIQTDATFSGLGTRHVARLIKNAEGWRGLVQGVSAVSAGYFLQGTAKFGIYDKLKRKLRDDLEARGEWNDHRKLPVYLAASGIAETVATMLLCPFEAAKIAVMTKRLDAPNSGKLLYVMDQIIKEGGPYALYRGLPMILLRQVPYSCVKLASYDLISERAMKLRGVVDSKMESLEALFDKLLGRTTTPGMGTGKGQGKVKTNLAPPALLTATEPEEGEKPVYIQMISGMGAGVLAAALSQPADVILSKICSSNPADAATCIMITRPRDLVAIARDLGFEGAFAGLKQRALMVGTMTAAQFIIYENVKARLTTRFSEEKP